MTTTSTLQIDRADIARTRWHDEPHLPLEPGQVRLRVEHVGLSANNVTYASLGVALHYWDFFPQADPAWGCVPVWGFATVVESACPEVDRGRRVFGYLPLATDVVVAPSRVDARGFVDASPHRSDLAAPYNRYVAVGEATEEGRDREAYEALMQPLFVTSLLIADWLAHEAWLGAERVLVSSASSKTSYALAYALAHLVEGERPEVVGLTSTSHVGSTEALGLYDRVLAYDDLATLDADVTTVYVDMSGNAEVRAAVHAHCRGLVHDCAVGLTHWDATAAPGAGRSLPGPAPVVFFAPTELGRQAERLGRAEHARRMSESLRGFVDRVSDPASPLLTLSWHEGRDAAATAWADAVAGRTDPSRGAAVTL